MSDNNSFLSNYNKKDGEQSTETPAPKKKKEGAADVAAPKSFNYEQKSGFKKPERKEPHPQRPDDGKRKRLITAIAAGGGALVVIIVVLILLLGGGIEVKDFTNGKLTDAQLWANENGMIITTENAYSDTVEEGYVIEQDVKPGSRIKKGSFIKLTVSLGHDLSVTLPLPDLESMTADQVQAWADENFMTKVRITAEFSADVPSGHVIRYEINDNTVVDEVRRDTPIYVIVSKGVEEAAETVKVPDLKSMPLAECYTFAAENGLTLTIDEQYDDYIPAGTIISQSVKADQMIAKGSEIVLVVSKGKMITVPDFSGYTKEQASAKAAELGLPITVAERYSSSSNGRLISQSIEAGSIYEAGDLLELTYSLGNKIVIASYEGQTRDALESWAQSLNDQGARLTIKATETKSSQPRGTIIYQDKANTSVSYRTTINITVSAGSVVYVPDFTGPQDGNYNNAITREKAIAMCEEIGLIPVFVQDGTSDVLPGEIWGQSIEPGTETSEGTTITLMFKPTEKYENVHDFVGMVQKDIETPDYLSLLTIIFEEDATYVGDGTDVVKTQSISPKSTVVRGTEIILLIGQPSTATPTPSPTPTASAAPTPTPTT